MLTVREHVDIAASTDSVFAFMDEPSHQPALSPSLTESSLLDRLPNGGSRVRYTYKIWGVPFSGEVRATDYVPNERIVWALTGDLHGTLRWYFEALDAENMTRFTYAATYALPGPSLLRPLLKPVLRRYNEREVRTILHRLKTHIEP